MAVHLLRAWTGALTTGRTGRDEVDKGRAQYRRLRSIRMCDL